MKVYLKDYNGNAASSINGQLKGLFFCAIPYLNTEKPADWSFFGSKRVSIPAPAMLTEDCNLYFADFYCYYNSERHYVTVVLTKPGSMSDRFCKEKLMNLDPRKNPFLYRKDNDEVWTSGNVWVEVFYTEDVQLSRPDCYFETVEVRGRGSSVP